MPTQKIQDKFTNLPLPYKLVGIGALIAFIGVFLPWYKDIDQFKTGDQFNGISGPLYLIGYIVIALSLFNLIFAGFHFLEKKLPSLPLKESLLYILSGAFSLFLLIITNSVYFHPKFGINIASKDVQFGMIFAFIGAMLIVIGGVLQNRERGTARMIEEFRSEAMDDEDIDEVITLNNFQKEQKTEKPFVERAKPATGVREYKSKSDWTPAERPQTANEHRAEPDRTSPSPYSAQPTTVRREPYPDASLIRKEKEPGRIMSAAPSSANKDKEEINPNSVIRMDL
ncbi:hypothetical protein JW911_04585 [Candidatus Peregrinibacteria bacterium]|nr:hypothetical protein [Candidatus Peregrinibacteria bacterium]